MTTPMPNPNIAALKELAEKAEASRHTIQFGNNAMNAFRQACKPTAILQIISHTAAVEAELAEVKGRLAAVIAACTKLYVDCSGVEQQTYHYCAICGQNSDDVPVSLPIEHAGDCPLSLSTPKAEPPVAGKCPEAVVHDGHSYVCHRGHVEICTHPQCPIRSAGKV